MDISENMNLLKELSTMYSGSKKSYVRGLGDSLAETAESLKPVIKGSTAVNDAYGNKLLSIGNQDESAKFTDYRFSNDTLNYQLWLCLYNDSWVFKRAIDKPAQDEIRCGLTIQGEFEKKNEVYRQLKRYNNEMIELLQWGGLFGGSVAVMMFDTFRDDDYRVRFEDNKKKVRQSKVMKLYVTDRWYGCAPKTDDVVDDMDDSDFGTPRSYDITFADGKTLTVHHDYVLRYEHRTAPPLIKRGQLQGWGYAEGSHILNELMRDDKLKTSIQSLIDKSLIEVIKMNGMRGLFMGTDPGNTEQLRKRLEMVNWARNFNSLTFLDSTDSYEMNSFSGLAGLADLLQQNMWQIAAALEMQGVLFGDLKSGFSNDADALERYAQTIQNRCESYVRPVHEKLLKMIYFKLGVDEKVEFDYNSLTMKKQDEEKMEGLKNFVELCQTLLDMGVLDTAKVGQAIVNFTKDGKIDFGLDEKYLQELSNTFENEMEGIDLGNIGKTV